MERRGQGWSQMRLIQYKLWLQYRCLRTSSIHCRGFKRLESCIFANVIITLSNLLHCNHGKLYWHRLSSKFSPGSCGARCGLRNAGWCWLLGPEERQTRTLSGATATVCADTAGAGQQPQSDQKSREINRLKMVIANKTH